MLIFIAGPRTMKTTSYAVPAILDAPGAVIATSNKRDIVDVTRPIRAKGGAVWVFDPQSVAEEDPTWWWNPLSYVKNEATAGNLAPHFANGSREPGTKPDAYLDSAGQNLLKAFLLAASLDSALVTQVYTWLTRPHDEAPAELLKTAGYDLLGHGDGPHPRTGEAAGRCPRHRPANGFLPDRPRGQPMGHPARDTTVDRDPRPQFVPEDFVGGKGMLYTSPVKVSTPLLGILDGAANVCRWKAPPDQYSHHGSRGIILMTILQSWSQGVEGWSLEGMRKPWSASNVKVYGSGVSKVGYLDEGVGAPVAASFSSPRDAVGRCQRRFLASSTPESEAG